MGCQVGLCPTCDSLSIGIRWRPPLAVAIANHLVTRSTIVLSGRRIWYGLRQDDLPQLALRAAGLAVWPRLSASVPASPGLASVRVFAGGIMGEANTTGPQPGSSVGADKPPLDAVPAQPAQPPQQKADAAPPGAAAADAVPPKKNSVFTFLLGKRPRLLLPSRPSSTWW